MCYIYGFTDTFYFMIILCLVVGTVVLKALKIELIFIVHYLIFWINLKI